ncbi:MAG: hypothetical protein Q9169_007633 [Polycauliona sp. 2 TL-2023]
MHPAKQLAEKCRLFEPNRFFHEVIFEWAIPEKYILHQVSLQTLIERGIHKDYFAPLADPAERMSTEQIRCYIANGIQGPSIWETGLSLGFWARRFGARAPVAWISRQLFQDCVGMTVLKAIGAFKLYYAHGPTEIVDFEYWNDLQDGIDTCLYEWWLADDEFNLRYAIFDEWRDMREESMVSDFVDLWELWYKPDHGGAEREISPEEQSLCDLAQEKISVKHARITSEIEEEAIRIGL